MEKLSPEQFAAQVLARLDKTSPDGLLASLAWEFATLYQANQALEARLVAAEVFQSTRDMVLASSGDAGPLPKSVFVDAAFTIPLEAGFYPLEYDTKGIPFRWTGPEPSFHFDVRVDRAGPVRFALRYGEILGQSPENHARCFADGGEVACETIQTDGEFELRGVLPKREGSGGTVVMFVSPGVRSPSEVGGSAETRKQGLRFRWLRIERIAEAVSALPLLTGDTAELDANSDSTQAKRSRAGAKTA